MAVRRRISIILPAAILAVALPGAASYLYYRFTGDPTMRPLAVTISSLADAGVLERDHRIFVIVHWGRDGKYAFHPGDVKAALVKALSVYPYKFSISFKDAPGDQIEVSYEVGESRLGPYPLRDAANGIPAAIDAMRITAQQPVEQ